MLQGYKEIHKLQDTEIHVEISSCSWSYPNYGLQISLMLPDNHKVFANKKIDFALVTKNDIDELVSSVSICKCSKCGKPTFDPKTAKTNRNGLCNHCFMLDLNSQIDLMFAERLAKEHELETSMKMEGHTHKTIMWVHPKHGDDKEAVLYTKGEPTSSEITDELKKLGSVVFDDYETIILK